MSDSVKITLSFTWDITKKEWVEGKEHWKENLVEGAKFDPVSSYHYLSMIKIPESEVNIIPS